MSKIYVNHHAFYGTSPFTSLLNAREAAISFIKYRVEVEVDLTDTIYIKDEIGKVVEIINADTVYGKNFDYETLTLSVCF